MRRTPDLRRTALRCAASGGSRLSSVERSLRPVLGLDLRREDHCLCAAVDAELLQDRRDVGFHGRFRDAERVGDLLVEHPLGQHHQHAHLLRSEAGEPREQRLHLRIGGQIEVDVRRRPDPALEHGGNRRADRVDSERLWDEARRAEVHAPANDRGILVPGDDHDRHAWVLRAQVQEPREAPHSRHGKIEQHQIHVAAAVDQSGDLVEAAGFGNVRLAKRPRDRLAQRAAEQRMIVGDDEAIECRVFQTVTKPGFDWRASSDGDCERASGA
jgi:hypothetical protein